jgi:flagellar motor switch protein FliG
MSEMTERYMFIPQLEGIGQGNHLTPSRTSREKVAILLAALNKDMAISLLRKFEPGSLRQLVESSGHLGALNAADFEPVVKEFTQEFAEALGISAGAEQLIPLLEAAFTKEKVSQLIRMQDVNTKASVWSKFTPQMDKLLVPFLLDEHEQTAALILSRLATDVAAKCLALLPRELTTRLLARTLSLRAVSNEALGILEQIVESNFFGKVVENNADKSIEKAASIINRMDRHAAQDVMEALGRTSPEQSKRLRKFIFMFEDLIKMDHKSKSILFDRVPAELVTPSLWAMDAEFKEGVLSCLSARARRMAESELGSDDGQPRADTVAARKKVAEIALAMVRKGEIALPDDAAIDELSAVA